MKLYTIDQLKHIYECYGFNLDQDGCCEIDEDKHFEQCVNQLTPIELPSDEEIEEKEAEKRFPYEKHMGDTWGNGLHEGFIIGAEWMKEQIINQNK